ncbi:MAG: SRPBCC family protein [Pseudolysinimonas sp.]
MTNPVTITAPEGLPFVDIEREFDAPVAAVFNAYRDPALFVQWIGPAGYTNELPRYDFTSGGGYRMVNIDETGQRFTFNGVFHVVRENEFAIQTFEFEGFPDVVSIESITFTPLPDDRSRINIHAVYPTLEARDGMVSSGMEHGVTEGYQKLDALVTGAKAA